MNQYPYYLSLIIPAYNEEKKIERDIIEAFSYFKKTRMKAEVIVSTDGVTDNTNNIVKKMQKKYKNLTLITKKEKIGKGASIKEAAKIAKGKYIMFADAGYCVPFRYIQNGLKKLKDGYDCALASRAFRISKIKKSQPFYRRVGSRIFGLIVRNLLGIPKNIRDTQCGFKIYKNKVMKNLFKDIKTKSFMFDIEVILRAKKMKYKMISFPVEWSNDADTKLDPIIGSIKNFKDLYLIKVRYKL